MYSSIPYLPTYSTKIHFFACYPSDITILCCFIILFHIKSLRFYKRRKMHHQITSPGVCTDNLYRHLEWSIKNATLIVNGRLVWPGSVPASEGDLTPNTHFSGSSQINVTFLMDHPPWLECTSLFFRSMPCLKVYCLPLCICCMKVPMSLSTCESFFASVSSCR